MSLAGAGAATGVAGAAGVGSSSASHFAAPLAPPAAAASAKFVFVKRAGDLDTGFAEVEIFETDSVTRLAKRASHELGWVVSANMVKLFLVPDAGGLVRAVQLDPAREADVLVDTNLCLATDTLAEASIRHRSCLLARLPDPPAAAPGECVRAALAASFRARRAGGRQTVR